VTAIVGVLITIASGLTAAFRWDKTWHVFTEAQMTLESALVRWELSMNLSGEGDDYESKKEATQQLLEVHAELIRTEAQSFFAGISQAPPPLGGNAIGVNEVGRQ
jgi:hypothetical protein